MHMCAGGSSTYAMFPELFDYSQAEDIGYLRVHRKTRGQNVSILRRRNKTEIISCILLTTFLLLYTSEI